MGDSKNEGEGKVQPDESEKLEIKKAKTLGEMEMSRSENIERVYTIPLERAWIAPRYRRAEKAISILKTFVQRHMKAESVIIDPKVNEFIWRRGIEKPPRRIRVKLLKDDEGAVKVSLAEAEEKDGED